MPYKLTIRNRHIDTILNEVSTKIPETEDSIDLSTSYESEGNEAFLINTITAENYVKVLQKLSRQVTSIDMSHNKLARFGPDLITVVKSLPENLTSLNWHDNDLYKLSIDVLVEVFQALPRTLSSFSLRGNILDILPAHDFVKAIQAIPEGIETLELSANLNNYSADEIIMILKSLPLGLKSLNLGFCDLDRFTVEELFKIFSELPENLHDLNLMYNNLAQIVLLKPEIMKAMPRNLRQLDVISNGFDKLPANDLAKIFKQVPENVSEVIMSYEPVKPLVFVIDNEISRLMNTHSASNSFWVNIGVMNASDAKIDALTVLKDMIGNRSNSDTFKEDLATWYGQYKNCIKLQRNKVHSFFQPDHKPGTQTIVDELFAHFCVEMEVKSSMTHPDL